MKLFKILETVSTNINLSFHHVFTDRPRSNLNSRTTLNEY